MIMRLRMSAAMTRLCSVSGGAVRHKKSGQVVVDGVELSSDSERTGDVADGEMITTLVVAHRFESDLWFARSLAGQ